MNGRMLIFIILGVLLVGVAITTAQLSSIGYQQENSTTLISGDINYKNIRDQMLIGYEVVYKNINYTTQICNYTNSTNITINTCWNETRTNLTVDTKTNGDPIYNLSSIKAIEYSSVRYDFNGYHGWVCGNFLCFLSDADGGTSVNSRPEEFKCSSNQCVIRPGETGGYKNLLTNQTTFIDGGGLNVKI